MPGQPHDSDHLLGVGDVFVIPFAYAAQARFRNAIATETDDMHTASLAVILDHQFGRCQLVSSFWIYSIIKISDAMRPV